MQSIGPAIGAQAELAQQQAARTDTGPSANQGATTDNEAVLERKAQEFKASFLGKMLKPMFEELQSDGMFGGGHGEKMFRGMLVEEYAQEMAKKTDFGLTSEIKNELMKAQEVG